MDDVVAGEDLVAVRATGERVSIQIRLGRPYQKSPESWACPVQVEPLYPRLPDVVGSSSLQALSLAQRLALYLLRGFIEDGGKLLYVGGDEFPIDAYSLEPGRGGKDAI